MPTFNRQNPSPLEDLFHELTIIMVINEKHVASARSHLLMCCIAYECFVDLKLVYYI